MMQRVLYVLVIYLIFGIQFLKADEKIEYLVDDNLLTIRISNLLANCCSGFVGDYYINYSNNTINFNLSDTTIQKCKCNCNFDISLNIGPLPQGKYTIIINKDEFIKFGYYKDKKITIGKKDIFIDDPHPKSPLIMEFKQSGCKNSSDIPIIEETLKGNVEVFPNPAVGSVSVRFNIKESGNVNIKILNFLGKELNDFKFKNLRSGVNTVHLDLGDVPPGMYIGKIITSNAQTSTFKLVWSK